MKQAAIAGAILLGGLLHSCVSPSTGFVEPAPRMDLAEDIGKQVCSGGIITYQPGYFSDAQIYTERVKLKPVYGMSKKLLLTNYAERVAVARGDGGYGFFDCMDGSYAIYSTRSPLPWAEITPTSWAEVTESWCRATKIMFAPDGLNRPVSQNNLTIKGRLDSQRGYVGVSCLPRAPSHLGPRLWFLVNKQSSHQLPFVSAIKKGVTPWLNKVRQVFDLDRVERRKVLSERQKKEIFAKGSIDHQRPLLSRIGQDLKLKAYTLLGEVRVRGRSLGDRLELLWRSPFHREFLISENLEYIEIIEENDGLVILGLRRSRSK